jgi:hypothetical protein
MSNGFTQGAKHSSAPSSGGNGMPEKSSAFTWAS